MSDAVAFCLLSLLALVMTVFYVRERDRRIEEERRDRERWLARMREKVEGRRHGGGRRPPGAA